MTISSKPKSRTLVPLPMFGAHRGAALALPAAARFNRESAAYELKPMYVDPIPNRARLLAERASEDGLDARWAEAKVEDWRAADVVDAKAIVAHTDRPGTQRTAIVAASKAQVPSLAYLAFSQDGPLFGLLVVLRPEDTHALERVVGFLTALEVVTRRSGSSALFGDQSTSQTRTAEPKLRERFAEHFTQNLPRVIADVELESAPLELSRAGQASVPLVVLPYADDWRDPQSLARDVLTELQTPLSRGDNFVVAEIVPAGMRLHDFRLRATDGRLAVSGTPLLPAPGQADIAPAVRRAAEDALRRSATISATFTRTSAIATSD